MGTSSERPPMPWSGTTLRRYSTPSGRVTTMVRSTSGTAMPAASRNSVVTCTVSPVR